MSAWRLAVQITSPDFGGIGVNQFCVDVQSPASDSGGVDALGAALEEFYTAMAVYSGEDTTFAWDGTAVELGTETPQLYTGGEPWSVPGGSTTQNLPPANCICITWRTGLASRSGRGRTFFNPITTDVVEGNGTPVETARTAMQEAVDGLVNALEEPNSWQYSVWSVKDQEAYQILSGSVPNEFAVLRSRRD